MNKKILKNFIKDHIGYAVLYFTNGLVLAIFYGISSHSKVEWLYPLFLSSFIFGIFIIIRWFKYYPFNLRIQKSAEDIYYDLSPATCEQHETSIVIERIHQKYMQKINTIQFDNKNNKHFITQWIHNMKTPVSVIDLVIQKNQKDEITPLNAISDIKTENERLLGNLDQILNLLRLEDFSRDYLPEKLDLCAALNRAIHGRKNQFIYNKVFPKVEPINEPVFVLSDAKWNEVILDQIISNAIKYSGNGNDSKNVFFIIEKNGDNVFLRIRDEGIGIPEYDINRVFEAFFTGENGRNHKNATGIGLYMCKIIAEKLGHKIELKSEAGQGTEVIITYLSKM